MHEVMKKYDNQIKEMFEKIKQQKKNQVKSKKEEKIKWEKQN